MKLYRGLIVNIVAVFAFVSMISCSGGCASTSANHVETLDTNAQIGEPAIEQPTETPEVAPDPDPLPYVTAQPQEPPLLRLAVIADMNGRYGSDQYDEEVVHSIDMIIEDHPDIVINAGDMVAGQKAKLDYRKMWTGFHSVVTDRLAEAGIPMAQTPGNHDGSAYSKYEKEREIYIDEWTKHKPALDYVDDTRYPLNYSFTKNGIFFISFDSTTMEKVPDEDFEWLEAQLQNNPSKYGAVIVFHVPLFPITTIKPTEIRRDDRLAPLFAKYHVQLVITGHQHAYFPAKQDGVLYLHVGAIGGGPRPVRQNDGILPKTLSFVNLYANHDPYVDTHIVSGESGKHFNHNLLPTYIVFGDKILPRVDISLEDANFAREYLISPHMPRSQMLNLIRALKANDGDWGRIPNWKPDN